MTTLNLLPATRLSEYARRARTRRWGVAAVAGAMAAWGAWGVMLASSPSDPAVRLELARLSTITEQRDRDIRDLTRETARYERAAALSAELFEHPDWGVVLDVLARAKGADVAYESIDIRPGAVVRAGKPASGVVVTITGIATSQVHATHLAVRIDETGLFDGVSPAQTQSRSTPGAPADTPAATLVGFTIRATLGASGAKEAR